MWDLPTLWWWLGRVSGIAATVGKLAWLRSPADGLSVWLAPLAGVASVLALALLAGIAVGMLTTLVILLLALSYMLTEVFGVSIEFGNPVPPGRQW